MSAGGGQLEPVLLTFGAAERASGYPGAGGYEPRACTGPGSVLVPDMYA